MTQLLFFKHNHSIDATLSVEQLQALPNPFDLVTAVPDTHIWSTAELTDPWFRIISWPLLTWPLSATALQFLEGTETTIKTHLFRYRARFLNLNAALIPMALKTWWLDDARAVPIFDVTLNPATVLTTIGVTRPLTAHS